LPNYEKYVIFVPKETGVKDPNGLTWQLKLWLEQGFISGSTK